MLLEFIIKNTGCDFVADDRGLFRSLNTQTTSKRRPIIPQTINMASTTASQTELKAARVPLAWRDQCSAHVLTLPQRRSERLIDILCRLLIPLNACRRKTAYMPWECTDERHGYEK